MASFEGEMDTDAEQMPAFDKVDREYKIFVDNLPEELNEVAIKQIFSQYGQITAMFYPHKATWAFITYSKYREAELAIRELSNKKPLYLKVALAKERSNVSEKIQSLPEILTERSIITDVAVEPLPVHNEMKSIGHGEALRKCLIMSQLAMPQKDSENGSLQSFSPTSSHISSAYDYEGPFVNTNRLWTRGMLTMSVDGKRHVSLGRGYTLYEIPEQNRNTEKYIKQVYDFRNNGVYEYPEDKLKDGLHKCLVCSMKTIKHCEKCYAYYCSRKCQVLDWPRHRDECGRIPALVEETTRDISSLQINREKNTSKADITDRIASNDVKLRRPNISMQLENSNNTNALSINKNNMPINNKYSNNEDGQPLIQCNSNANISQAKSSRPTSITNTKVSFLQHRLQKHNYANENTDQLRRNDECSSISGSDSSQNSTRNYQNYATNRDDSNKEMSNNNSRRNGRPGYNIDKNQHCQKNEFQDNKKSFCDDKETSNIRRHRSINNVMDEDMNFHKDTYLSKTKFTDVEVIISLGNGEYWIYKIEDTDMRIDLMTELQNIASKSHNVKPIIGDIYGVMYETIWHRAMIIDLNPVKVHFIDFGNYEILGKNVDIKDIGDLTKINRIARKIRLTHDDKEKWKDLSYGDKISVRMLSMDSEKTILVKVQEQSESSTSAVENALQSSKTSKIIEKPMSQEKSKVSSNTDEKTSVIQLPTVMDALADLLAKRADSKLNFTGVIHIFDSMQKNVYSATFFPQPLADSMEVILDKLPEECTKIKESVNFKPRVGDLVCCEDKEEDWYRGYVSTLSPILQIEVVDEARTVPMCRACPYPNEFLNTCTFGVICEIVGELEVRTPYHFTATINENDIQQGNLKIEITTDTKILPAVVKPWKLITKLPAPAFTELRSGSKICLTSYRNQHLTFAHSLDKQELEYSNNIIQRVAKCALTAPHLSKPPSPGQMVIAPYSDGNNYRAMVTKVQGDKVTIVYVDFGNFEDTVVNKLLVLPDDLGMQRSCTAKIILKDVPRDVPMTAEVDAYLRDLIGKEIPLTCVYEGTPMNGVHLTTPAGESVNDKIKQLLIPSWKRENDKTRYTLNNIEIANLGRVGETVEALVLFIQEDKMNYMMGPCDMELMAHIIDVMPALMKEYCESTEYYIPRTSELCLALYEEAWYRAICVNPQHSRNTCEIFFIDYGNMETVEHKNVRAMPNDFIKPAAMANLCNVVNLASVDNTGNYSPAVKQKLGELVSSNTVVKIKIVECSEPGEYKIELPDVRTVLIEQGLVSST